MKRSAYIYEIMKSSIRKLFVLFCLIASNISAQNYEEIDFAQLSKMLDKEYAKDFEFSVLIESDHRVLYSENFGYLDKNHVHPVNDKTLYNIASITKSVTAIGILKLVEQNKLHLSDRLDHRSGL